MPQAIRSIDQHGELVGLDSDDHPQYLTAARGDARYDLLGAAADVLSSLGLHTARADNPHGVTAAQTGALTQTQGDGRYLPLAGGSLSGALTLTSGQLKSSGGVSLSLESSNSYVRVRSGANPQFVEVANTWSDDANNESLLVGFNGNIGYVRTTQRGTGSVRDLKLAVPGGASLWFAHYGVADRWKIDPNGHYLTVADNTYDIGSAASNRPRHVHVAQDVQAGGRIFVGAGLPGQWDTALEVKPVAYATSMRASVRIGDWSLAQSAGADAVEDFMVYDYNAGTARLVIDTDGALGLGGKDVRLYRDGANALAQRSGANPQVLRLYNTYTNGANYERFHAAWGGNALYLFTDQGGTGVARHLYLGTAGAAQIRLSTNNVFRWAIDAVAGHLIAAADNTSDIGLYGANRPRNLYVAGAIVNRTKAGAPTDADVANPADGMTVVDTTNHRLYVRSGGGWRSVALT